MSKIEWKTEKRKIEDLKEWDKNPRNLTEKGLSDLKESIIKFGLAEPLVINLNNVICGGHGRLKILKELEIKEVDCYIPNKELSEKQFEELNIRLNKNIAGQWDFSKLEELFDVDDLQEWGFEEHELINYDDEIFKNEEIDENDENDIKKDLNIECPKCGFMFKKD